MIDSTLDVEPRGSGLIGNCVSCYLPLPLRLPNVAEKGQKWRCSGCGETYNALLAETGPAAKLRRNVDFVAMQPSSSLTAAGFRPNGTAVTALSSRRRILCPVHTPLSRAMGELPRSGIT